LPLDLVKERRIEPSDWSAPMDNGAGQQQSIPRGATLDPRPPGVRMLIPRAEVPKPTNQ